jgi:CheY-like chemotaxis protein
MWRDAVARDLAEAGYEVAATASDGAQALRVLGAVRPDVVVLDLQLPDMSGVEVTRALRAASPSVRVLVLSASGEQQDVLDAVKAGAAGYLVKSAARAEFLDAVRRTADGDAVFTPGSCGPGARRIPPAGQRPGDERHWRSPGGADAHDEGNRDPAHGRDWAVIQANRVPPGPVPPHRAEPRAEHPGQAAPAQPRRAGPLRDLAADPD